MSAAKTAECCDMTAALRPLAPRSLGPSLGQAAKSSGRRLEMRRCSPVGASAAASTAVATATPTRSSSRADAAFPPRLKCATPVLARAVSRLAGVPFPRWSRLASCSTQRVAASTSVSVLPNRSTNRCRGSNSCSGSVMPSSPSSVQSAPKASCAADKSRSKASLRSAAQL
eukprot:scaffold12391_cov120-Isochrysis_galbana.AAC.1